ncbi:hypothetical protein APUTEX25_004197 [Auxenochlorella protothecoides]|uniref:BZIP domain-containing protein n=1 Tax=Auxenochlorella protothecoides TaxID=3075 RepID=A0A3M7L3P8_AUXPR|nr:hypothetical protein APUTEX25_004197 [Auxenochlorella protothecoides]|eukprot:RMZ57363.1 hypothetical protein APUTEX25_004197 [Auxenochlorella protothecoides]
MERTMSITSDELLQNFFKTGSTVSLPRIDSESQLNGSVALALGRAKLEAEDRGAGNNEGQPGSATCGPRSEGGSRGDTPTAHGRGLAASALTAPGLPQQPDFPSGNLQIAGLQGAGPHMVLNPNGGLALEPGSKQAVRRERRMLPARRSRKRKQEHLSTMEARLAESERGREEALARCARLAEDLRRRDVELAALRADLLCRGGPDDGAAPAAEAGAGA